MLFSIRIAEWPSVWRKAVHSVYCARLSWKLINLCVCFFPIFEGGMGILIALVPDQTFYIARRPVPEYVIVYL